MGLVPMLQTLGGAREFLWVDLDSLQLFLGTDDLGMSDVVMAARTKDTILAWTTNGECFRKPPKGEEGWQPSEELSCHSWVQVGSSLAKKFVMLLDNEGSVWEFKSESFKKLSFSPRVTMFGCTDDSCTLVDEEHQVWGMGSTRRRFGRLSGTLNYFIIAEKLSPLLGIRCGYFTTLVLTEEGKIFSSGDETFSPCYKEGEFCELISIPKEFVGMSVGY